jgi:hypothetical protein
MRSYFFTEKEREMLVRWLETGETDQQLMNLFTSIRKNTPVLRADLRLLLVVLRKKSAEKRGKGYHSIKTEFGSTLRRAESLLKYTRRVAR